MIFKLYKNVIASLVESIYDFKLNLEEEQQFICQHFFSFFEAENIDDNFKIGNQNNSYPQKFIDSFI